MHAHLAGLIWANHVLEYIENLTKPGKTPCSSVKTLEEDSLFLVMQSNCAHFQDPSMTMWRTWDFIMTFSSGLMLSVTGAGLLSENNCFQLSRYYGEPHNLRVTVGVRTWFSKRSGILRAGESTTKTAYQKKDLSARSQRTPQVITFKFSVYAPDLNGVFKWY